MGYFIPDSRDLGTINSEYAQFAFNTGSYPYAKNFVFKAELYLNGAWKEVASRTVSLNPNMDSYITFGNLSSSYNWVIEGGCNARIKIMEEGYTLPSFTGTAFLKVFDYDLISPVQSVVYDSHPNLVFNTTNMKFVECYFTINSSSTKYLITPVEDKQTVTVELDESIYQGLQDGLNTIKLYVKGSLKYTRSYTKKASEVIPEVDPAVELIHPVSTRNYSDNPKLYARVTGGNGKRIKLFIDSSLNDEFLINSDDYIIEHTITGMNDGYQKLLELKAPSGNIVASTKFKQLTTPDNPIEFNVASPIEGGSYFINEPINLNYTIKNANNRYYYLFCYTVNNGEETILPPTSIIESSNFTQTGSISIKEKSTVQFKFYAQDLPEDPYKTLLKTVTINVGERPITPTIEITSPTSGGTFPSHPSLSFTAKNADGKTIKCIVNDVQIAKEFVVSGNSYSDEIAMSLYGKEGLNNIKLQIDGVTLAEFNYTKETAVDSRIYFSEPIQGKSYDLPPRIAVSSINSSGKTYKILLNGIEYPGKTIEGNNGTNYFYDITTYGVSGNNILQIKVGEDIVAETNYIYNISGQPKITIMSPLQAGEYTKHPKLVVKYENVYGRNYRCYLNSQYLVQHDITSFNQEETFDISTVSFASLITGTCKITIEDISTNEVVATVTYVKKVSSTDRYINVISPTNNSEYSIHPELEFDVFNCESSICKINVNYSQVDIVNIESNNQKVKLDLSKYAREGYNYIAIYIGDELFNEINYTKSNGTVIPPDPEYVLKMYIPELTEPVNSLSSVQVTSHCTNNTRLEVVVDYDFKQIKDFMDFDAGYVTKSFTFNKSLWDSVPENTSFDVTFKLIDNTDNSRYVTRTYIGRKINGIIDVSYKVKTDKKITKMLLIADYKLDSGIKVEFTNNPYIDNPKWEDVTIKFLTNKIHIFPNEEVAIPGYGFRINMTGPNSKIGNFTVYTY